MYNSDCPFFLVIIYRSPNSGPDNRAGHLPREAISGPQPAASDQTREAGIQRREEAKEI